MQSYTIVVQIVPKYKLCRPSEGKEEFTMNKWKRALLVGTIAASVMTFAACSRKIDDDLHVTMTPDRTTASPTASATPDMDILPSMDIELATISPEVK